MTSYADGYVHVLLDFFLIRDESSNFFCLKYTSEQLNIFLKFDTNIGFKKLCIYSSLMIADYVST